MLVCRDWQRAKEYGFEIKEVPCSNSKTYARLEKEVDENSVAIITLYDSKLFISGKVDYIKDVQEVNAIDLDFLYDMIKDGVIEKVEE